jgi:DNA repair exonuclease SbcCD ATPase subunit
MSDTANLTKKEQQELRGAEARISRVAKLQQQLEEAREQASKNTVKKIEDINAQVEKLDERTDKVEEQIAAVQQRKQHLLDRRDELVKAKHALADEIEEFLSHDDRVRLHLDVPEAVGDNTPLTAEQAEVIAEQAEQAEANGTDVEGEDETPAEADAKEEAAEAEAEVKTEAPAKPTRTRAKAK